MKGPLLVALLASAACHSSSDARHASASEKAPVASQPQAAPAARASAPGLAQDAAWHGARASDWLSWRGPHQNGTADETELPSSIDAAHPLWSVPISGRGTPVVAAGRVYTLGYTGEAATLLEMLVCLDERDGRVLWQKTFRDFLSDTVYSRYSIGSPTVDPETGNVYIQTTEGRLIAYSRDGAVVWEHSMMEEHGKYTFPNGRTGAPLIAGDRLVMHMINVSWGPYAPARDRFYAFDKLTGECLWSATPGDVPLDNSFSMPVVDRRGGRDVFYAETGCGFIVCIDLGSGDPLWRFRMATGAANASVVQHGDLLIGVHGGENLDTSSIGRLVAIKLPAEPKAGEKGPLDLPADAEAWRVELESFSSSPVLAGERVYLTDESGELCAVDVNTGKLFWRHKLAADQVHASPLFADGKLYVPMNNGSFYIIKPKDEGPEILDQEQLEGNCLGAPAVANGRLYVHTNVKLYCFGNPQGSRRGGPAAVEAASAAAPGAAARIQIVPADVVVRPGQTLRFAARGLDALGHTTGALSGVAWASDLGLAQQADGSWLVKPDAKPAAGPLKAEAAGLKGEARVRIVPKLPYKIDFEAVALDQGPADAPEEQKFGFPPSFWLSARNKWDVRLKDGAKVLARVMDNPLFQRTMSLFGDPLDKNYSVQVDVMVEGNRRLMSSVGVVDQRYLIVMKGNYQEIEVSSNVEGLKVSAPLEIVPGTWYTLRSRVDLQPDGSGVVRAKVWKRGAAEPSAWTIEVPHANAHQNGAAGLFGFTPQSRFKVYVDNLQVTPNE